MLEIIQRIVVNVVYLGAFMTSFGLLIKQLYLGRNFSTECAGRIIAENFINYYISAILVIEISEYVYYEIAENLNLEGFLEYLLKAGFFLTLMLICSGRLIDAFYMFTRNKKFALLRKKRSQNVLEMKENEKTYCICWSCIATIIISPMFNYMISVYAVAIFLGRFFWFDSNVGREKSSMKRFLQDIFVSMNDQDRKINGSVIKIKNMIIVGSALCMLLHMPFKILMNHTFAMF